MNRRLTWWLSILAIISLLLLVQQPGVESTSDSAAEVDVDIDDVLVSEEDASSSSVPLSSSSDDVDVDVEAGLDGDSESPQPLTLETLPSSPDISTTVYFPQFTDKRFTAGEEVSVLIGVSNSGDRPYNLTYITGSLHSPFDYSYYIQNFTVGLINAVVDAGTEISVEYRFKPDPNLEPLEFHFSGYFLYNTTDDREIYRSTFYNGTVELLEKSRDFNTRTIFSYVLVLAVVGLIGYFLFESKYTKSVRRSTTTRRTAEWSASVYVPAQKSRPAVKKRSKKPNKSNNSTNSTSNDQDED